MSYFSNKGISEHSYLVQIEEKQAQICAEGCEGGSPWYHFELSWGEFSKVEQSWGELSRVE